MPQYEAGEKLSCEPKVLRTFLNGACEVEVVPGLVVTVSDDLMPRFHKAPKRGKADADDAAESPPAKAAKK